MALLGNLKGSAQVFQDTEFYNGAISQSLRLSVGSNYKLDRQMVTPTSVTGTICTASWWMKKSAHGTIQSFIQCRDNQASGNYAAYWSYDTSFGSTGDHHVEQLIRKDYSSLFQMVRHNSRHDTLYLLHIHCQNLQLIPLHY